MEYNKLPQVKTFTAEKLKSLASSFVPPKGSAYHLPRIAFFGLFNYLSMTDQRYICKQLGFEYIAEIPFGTTNDQQLSMLKTKWREITRHTHLVVIGDEYNDDIFADLYRCYAMKNDGIKREPIIIENNIPVIMELELVKIHQDYPNINKATSWNYLNL